jgi:polar amino acid transport system substrate-binding protein
MISIFRRFLLVTFCLLAAASSHAQSGPVAAVADLKSSGKLRVGLGLVPTFAMKDPSTGELRGIGVELGRALAERIGVEFVPVTYPSPANIPEGSKTGALDIGFLGIDPARQAVMDFSIPYVQVDATFLFPAGSTYRSFNDVDKPGVRIVTTRNGVEDLALTRLIKVAEIIRVGSAGAGLEALKTGKADAVAIPRPTAIAFAEQLPGSRVWDDRYDVAIHAIGVPKGESGRLNYINEFLSGAKKSGFVQQAMERVGLRGAQVAPD